MKKALLLLGLLSAWAYSAHSQQKYFISNQARIVKQNGDSLKFPFVGGFNSPQFSSIKLNNDSFPDLFIFDRSGDKVITFISDGKGNFIYAPEYEHLFPRMMDWALLVDYNGDGKPDIFTHNIEKYTGSWISVFKNQHLTMPVFQLQHSVLQMVRDTNYLWNPDSMRFDTIIYNAQAVNNFPFSIPAITDINGDGDIDILANDPNSARAELYSNYSKQWGFPNDSLRFRKVDVEWGYYMDGTKAAPYYDSLGGVSGWHEYDTMILNSYTYAKMYKKHSGGSTMLLVDFDSDGDLELMQGNVSFKRLWYLDNGKSDFAHKYDTLIGADSIWPQGTTRAAIHDFAAAFHVDADQDGLKDIIVASNKRVDGKLTDNIMLYKNVGDSIQADFTFVQDDFLSEHTLDHGKNSVPCFFDFDGDADEDLLIAASGDSGVLGVLGARIYVYERKSNRVFQLVNSDYLSLSHRKLKAIYPAFGDLNGDGKKDLLIGTDNGKMLHFRNNSSGAAASFVFETDFYGSINVGAHSVPQIIDVNQDLSNDLLIGNEAGRIVYLRNTGTNTSPVFSIQNAQFGDINAKEFTTAYEPPRYEDEGRAYPLLCDIEGDGNYDLFVGNFRGYVKLYRNISSNLSATFLEDSTFINFLGASTYGRQSFGNYSSIACSKIDNDSVIDLMIGNSRGGITLLGSMATISGKLTVNDEAKTNLQLIRAYPNPVQDWLKVEFTESAPLRLTVTDMMGRTIMELNPAKNSEFTRLNLAALSNGVYFLRAEAANGAVQCVKIIVSR